MPKKFQQKALLTKPSSSVPCHFSTSSRGTESSQNASASKPSVNALIQELRRADVQNHRDISAANLPSVHPALRDVLDRPVPTQPAPRSHLRGPATTRRIPGPPPPRSWLSDSIHAPNRDESRESNRWLQSRVQYQSSTLPGVDLPKHDSLIHHALKKMATLWSWHAEFDHTYVAELPVRMREILLSYLAIYDVLHWPNPLPFLFPIAIDGDEASEVHRLDFSNLLGSCLSIKSITKFLRNSSIPKPDLLRVRNDVPDSWDADDEITTSSIPTLKSNHQRFINLKHLSLAINPTSITSGASWSGLITLANEISTIKSLSLAYWPQPTYTPNASKGRYKVSNSISTTLPSVTYGGSDFYTAFDNDWREAAGILRSLSRALYCLEWLDLTGCVQWYPALIWQPPSRYEQEDQENELWKSKGPDWNGSWRGLKKMIMTVGWRPASGLEDDLSSTSDGSMSFSSETFLKHQEALDRLSSLRLGENAVQAQDWDTRQERRKYYHQKEIERYQEAQNQAKMVAQGIRTLRQGQGGHWIDFEFDENAED